jgi:membrane protease YdiL (CAAX protease family)
LSLSKQPKKIWFEVVILYVLAIGLLAGLRALSFIPFVRENLGGFAGIVFLFLPIEYLFRQKANLIEFGLTRKHLWQGLQCAAVLAMIAFPLYVPAYKWWFNRSAFHFSLSFAFGLEVIGTIFLVALPEEIFYRGYMQTRLDHVFKGRLQVFGAELGWSVVVTSAFFAVGHLLEFKPDRLGTFFPGLVFGWLRAKTGSIGGAVAFHSACNVWAAFLHNSYF